MKKITTEVELEMVSIELKNLMEKHSGEIDLKSIGLDI